MMPSDHARRVAIYAGIASLGGFLFGFDASVISGVEGLVTAEFGLSDLETGLVVSAPTLAAVLAGLIIGPASDAVGRKRVLFAVAALYLLSAVTSALAPGFWALVAARALGGVAFGSLLLAPMYIAEISPHRLRGRFVSINQLNIMVGMSVAYFSNYFLMGWSQEAGPLAEALRLDEFAWRWMLGLEALPAAAFCALLIFIPESPRWLAAQGRVDDARRVLAKITPPAAADQTITEIRQSIAAFDKRHTNRLAALLRPELRLPLLVGAVVAIAQQITGINAVFFYATSIFEQCGIGAKAAYMQATYIGLVNLVFTVLAMWLIDKLGRKPLMLVGLTSVAISMAISAYGFSQARYTITADSLSQLEANQILSSPNGARLDRLVGREFSNDVAFKRALREALGHSDFLKLESDLLKVAIQMNPYIVLVGVLGFVASFALSLGPVMWVLLSEIYPSAIRGLAMAVVGLVNSGVSWGVQFVFPWQLNNLGSSLTFLLYGVSALVCLITVSLLLPETRGKTLEEIEQQWPSSKVAKPSPA